MKDLPTAGNGHSHLQKEFLILFYLQHPPLLNFAIFNYFDGNQSCLKSHFLCERVVSFYVLGLVLKKNAKASKKGIKKT